MRGLDLALYHVNRKLSQLVRTAELLVRTMPGWRARYPVVNVEIVADYGHGDDAFGQAANRQIAWGEMVRRQVVIAGCYSTHQPFNTIEAGYLIAQHVFTGESMSVAEQPRVRNHIVFHNVAPRFDSKEVRPRNEGEGLVAWFDARGRLRAFGVFAGYTLSLLKLLPGGQFYALEYEVGKFDASQFRSRTIFPKVMYQLLRHLDLFPRQMPTAAKLTEWRRRTPWLKDVRRLPANEIPDLPLDVIIYCDGYGNLKLSTPFSVIRTRYEVGTALLVHVAGTIAEAHLAGGSFTVPNGKLALSRGSSGGWLGYTPAGEKDRLAELFLRGNSANGLFYPTAHGAKLAGGTPVLYATAAELQASLVGLQAVAAGQEIPDDLRDQLWSSDRTTAQRLLFRWATAAQLTAAELVALATDRQLAARLLTPTVLAQLRPAATPRGQAA